MASKSLIFCDKSVFHIVNGSSLRTGQNWEAKANSDLRSMLDAKHKSSYRLAMNKLDTKTRAQILSLLVEGTSMRASTRSVMVHQKPNPIGFHAKLPGKR